MAYCFCVTFTCSLAYFSLELLSFFILYMFYYVILDWVSKVTFGLDKEIYFFVLLDG